MNSHTSVTAVKMDECGATCLTGAIPQFAGPSIGYLFFLALRVWLSRLTPRPHLCSVEHSIRQIADILWAPEPTGTPLQRLVEEEVARLVGAGSRAETARRISAWVRFPSSGDVRVNLGLFPF